MDSSKIENQLNLALSVPEATRAATRNLNVGFDASTRTWELIVKYTGSLHRVRDELQITAVEMMNEYAILTIPENQIPSLAGYTEIEFIEMPKHLYFEVNEGNTASCINPLQSGSYQLFGEGVLIAIIDSGIDYSHPDFRNEDGTTRISVLWDQTIRGTPPEGYDIGTVYTREEINEALQTPMPERLDIVPSTDLSGHGTHVAGIAAGNGRASGGANRGVASQSELIIIKLGMALNGSFPMTTQLMRGIDFSIRYAIRMGRPLVINLSFGNNYGSHTGLSLIENFINDAAQLWRTSIVIGTGNEGITGNHAAGFLNMGTNTVIDLAVSEAEPTLNVQIWKNYYDHFDISITAPNGTRVGPIPRVLGTQRFFISQTEILLYYGDPVPFNPQQEIYIEFVPRGTYINSGVWRIELVPRKVVVGNYDLWLPAGGVTNSQTRFLLSNEFTTLTIPSTTFRAITVGAYDSFTGSYAPFSGRGFTRNDQVKPDLVAPGVNITSCAPGGGYATLSGTSMAAPFVSGAAALLMEWGIVRGNDPYLYGEKLKVYLIDGCRPLRIETVYPNRTLGYGALCLEDTFNNIV